MRIAFFSPLPPAKSGIADYCEALLEPLSQLSDVTVYSSRAGVAAFDANCFDVLLYQLGNNPAHDFVYETALRHPGVAVLHEANLHYLVADLTLNAGKNEEYWREVAENGGARTETRRQR